MALREISFRDLIKPIEDPSKNYPFNPKPISPYNRIPLTNQVSYGTQKQFYNNKISYSDWDYHKKKRKSLEYDSSKPFHGSYEGNGSNNYSFSSSKFSSGSYKMAA